MVSVACQLFRQQGLGLPCQRNMLVNLNAAGQAPDRRDFDAVRQFLRLTNEVWPVLCEACVAKVLTKRCAHLFGNHESWCCLSE
jgi:hypothetical protein